ncbi:hypothetical protein P5673_031273 [Acropora cervicornis]|uniref:Uncharacterized protein n=1 Tax=Acropora cervicornis TaxID=6130 RepID=A0AAD9USX1_ACRCE|nr:hypothetical protein P5673_031273 [Acropora cervicornis]
MEGEIDTEQFMEEIRKYDRLFNRFSKEFKDKFKEINAWSKVSEVFSISPAAAEKTFRDDNEARVEFLSALLSLVLSNCIDIVGILQAHESKSQVFGILHDVLSKWELNTVGSESQCKDKQIQLEQICENISDKDEESADEDDSMAVGPVEKRKRVKQLSSEDENEQEESNGFKVMGYYHNPHQDFKEILQELREILINPSNLLQDLDKNLLDVEKILLILYNPKDKECWRTYDIPQQFHWI